MSGETMRGLNEVHWVSTQWLESRVEDEYLMVLDCQPDIHDYIQMHIPRAVYISERVLRSAWRGMPGEWIPPRAAEAIFRRLGLHAGLPVVVYAGKGLNKGWGDGLEQTMVAYSLVRYGHSIVYVLDLGLDKWLKESRPGSQAFPRTRASGFRASARSEIYVQYEEFRRINDEDDVIVLDARPANVYAGQGPWVRNGHIPGAVNLPWRSLMDVQNPALLRPDRELSELIAACGVTKDKLVICTCGTGREATNEYLLFKHGLGYPRVRLYEGSYTEWTAYPENPVVTGPNPR